MKQHKLLRLKGGWNPKLLLCSQLIEAILDFIYPPYCIICRFRLDSGSKLICENCWKNLPRVQNTLNGSNYQDKNSYISCFLSVWEYNDAVQKVIHEMKYFRKKSLARLMGVEMANLVLENEEYSGADLIIPVPLHKTKLRERGFNQSIILSQIISLRTKIPYVTKILKRIRYTKPQSKLSAVEREKNVQGAFKVFKSQSLKGKVVILIDDVLTTGSTLRACADTLKDAGVTKILVLTAAKSI